MTNATPVWPRGIPAVGQTAARSRAVTARDIERFTEMTGDRNPLHYDEALARQTRMGGIVVQGGVTSGILNAVVAEDLPGPGTVFLRTATDPSINNATSTKQNLDGRTDLVVLASDQDTRFYLHNVLDLESPAEPPAIASARLSSAPLLRIALMITAIASGSASSVRR